ncbi:MAG: IS66 family insertion sequence element accessory protein TnpB, partial [Terracidiphilus sp.]
ATGATDMRKGFNGLYGVVRDGLGWAPESGHVFLFTNARKNRLKLLVYDGSWLFLGELVSTRARLRFTNQVQYPAEWP